MTDAERLERGEPVRRDELPDADEEVRELVRALLACREISQMWHQHDSGPKYTSICAVCIAARAVLGEAPPEAPHHA